MRVLLNVLYYTCTTPVCTPTPPSVLIRQIKISENLSTRHVFVTIYLCDDDLTFCTNHLINLAGENGNKM